MKIIAAIASILSLAVCLIAPVLFFIGTTDESTFKSVLLIASVAYFVAATLWAGRARPAGAQST